MPAPYRRWLYQRALIWAATGTSDRYGQPNVAASPTEIGLRWLTNLSERADKDGHTVQIPGTAVVDQDVPIDSWMWLGSLSEWLGTGSAYSDEQLLKVKDFNSTPDIKGRDRNRVVTLMKLHNKGSN